MRVSVNHLIVSSVLDPEGVGLAEEFGTQSAHGRDEVTDKPLDHKIAATDSVQVAIAKAHGLADHVELDIHSLDVSWKYTLSEDSYSLSERILEHEATIGDCRFVVIAADDVLSETQVANLIIFAARHLEENLQYFERLGFERKDFPAKFMVVLSALLKEDAADWSQDDLTVDLSYLGLPQGEYAFTHELTHRLRLAGRRVMISQDDRFFSRGIATSLDECLAFYFGSSRRGTTCTASTGGSIQHQSLQCSFARYMEYTDPHDLGAALMHFAWQLRELLVSHYDVSGQHMSDRVMFQVLQESREINPLLLCDKASTAMVFRQLLEHALGDQLPTFLPTAREMFDNMGFSFSDMKARTHPLPELVTTYDQYSDNIDLSQVEVRTGFLKADEQLFALDTCFGVPALPVDPSIHIGGCFSGVYETRTFRLSWPSEMESSGQQLLFVALPQDLSEREILQQLIKEYFQRLLPDRQVLFEI